MPSVIRGLDSTKRALRKLSPELYKEMNSEIKTALAAITSDARTNVPSGIIGLSNWKAFGTSRKITKATSMFRNANAFPMLNTAAAKAGIVYKMSSGHVNSSGFRAAYSVLNKSPAGAIAETAGRKNPQGRPTSKSNNPNAGAHFIEALNHGLGAVEALHVPVGMKSSDKHGGRLLYASVNRNEGKAKASIIRAIEKASNTINREMK
ncbi:MAG: hypothetical protein WCL21_18245 [Mariniphaga sp.]